MFAVTHASSGRLTVTLASKSREPIFSSHDRGLCVREASWMNMILDLGEALPEDTDAQFRSPHTGRDFYVSGEISQEQCDHIRELCEVA